MQSSAFGVIVRTAGSNYVCLPCMGADHVYAFCGDIPNVGENLLAGSSFGSDQK